MDTVEMDCGLEPQAQFSETIKDASVSEEVASPDPQYLVTGTHGLSHENGLVNNDELPPQSSGIDVNTDSADNETSQNDFNMGSGFLESENPIASIDKNVSQDSIHDNTGNVVLIQSESLEQIEEVVESQDSNEEVILHSEVLHAELNDVLSPVTINTEIPTQGTAIQNTSDILAELQGRNTEFNDDLPSHVVSEPLQNSELETSKQVLNKKELLDILEGNEPDFTAENEIREQHVDEDYDPREKMKQLALQQLNSFSKRIDKGKINKTTSAKSVSKTSENEITENKNLNVAAESGLKKENFQECLQISENKSKDLIKVLVEDWSDDETNEAEITQSQVINFSTTGNEILDHGSDTNHIKNIDLTPQIDSITPPQRRMSRVIKKKVIFDPDNPDTFTSKKTFQTIKTKSPQTNEDQLEQPPSKKTKSESSTAKIKEKSPLAKEKSTLNKEKSSGIKTKSHWKKPPPKNNKHHKRLSEVDKLLMDEGAVNMMYQLNTTGESDTPKGKKNIRSKAAFIKKINQSTPETNEIKFRERKKETVRVEEVTGVNGRRARTSISTSGLASSPAPDTFETHNADDSIIIRRHSSSSYSSSCLSPRRLSDFELPIPSAVKRPSTDAPVKLEDDKFTEVFMSDMTNIKKCDTLGKDECLSLKEKLNSKLSRVLNVKRAREIKTEGKQKKLKAKKNLPTSSNVIPIFEKVNVTIKERVAEINIMKTENENITIYNIDTFRELTSALQYVDGRADVSVVLLLSAAGDLCGGLDLEGMRLTGSDKHRFKAAHNLSNAARTLFVCLEQHSKFVCAGVEGTCVGAGLAMLALCDVVLASDRAAFRLVGGDGRLAPAVAVLLSHRKSLCRSLVTEMLVFGRQLSASEALGRGLVSRTLWPERFGPELRAMVLDIAAQPLESLQLKKKLLGLRNNMEAESTFLFCLDAERDLLATHWGGEAAAPAATTPH